MLLFPAGSIDEIITSNSWMLVAWATVVLGILATISLRTKKLTAFAKKVLFSSIVLVVILPTLYMGISTVYLNVISQSGGPVHWHADIEIWRCGEELDLVNPEGISNKIGTPTFHEHNDKRLHVEGVVVRQEDVNLQRFFNVIGGELTQTSLTVPTTKGDVVLQPGTCSGAPAELQAYVYQTTDDGFFQQKKLAIPGAYVLSPEPNVPSGDCIIIEYGPVKARTDKMCRSYKVAQEIGKLKGERK